MGFESSRAARRRLAAVAATNRRVQEALSSSTFPGFFGDTQQDVDLSHHTEQANATMESSDLHDQLDVLAQDIIATPGAGGALLVREAGGMVGDFQGADGFLDSGRIVAANAKLFSPLLQALSKRS